MNNYLFQVDKPAAILLVEDRISEVDLMQEALQECERAYHLYVVRNGEEALAFLRQQGKYECVPHPDLILLDLNLPKLNGCEVLAEIKTDPKLKFLPVVVFTTSTADWDILKSYDLQANCYIIKPAELEQFFEVVKNTMKFWLSFASLPFISNH